MTELIGLECGWCGGTAITSVTGYFAEDDGVECAECHFPGHVGIEENSHAGEYAGDEDEPAYTAYWVTHDEDDATILAWAKKCPDQLADLAPGLIPDELLEQIEAAG